MSLLSCAGRRACGYLIAKCFFGKSPTMRYRSRSGSVARMERSAIRTGRSRISLRFIRATTTGSPQPRLYDQRVDVVLEVPHVVEIARPRHHRPVEADRGEPGKAVDDLLLGADQRKAAPAGDEMHLQVLEPFGRAWRIEAHGVDQVRGRLPVALLVHVLVEIVLRLLLGLAVHHVGVRPDLQVAAVLLARELAVALDRGA